MSLDAVRLWPSLGAAALLFALLTPNYALADGEAPAANDEAEVANDEGAASEDEVAHTEEEPAADEARPFDRIVLANGEIHEGTFQGLKDGKYRLGTGGFGTVKAAPGDVSRIELREERTYYAKPTRLVGGRPIRMASRDGQLLWAPAGEEPAAFDPSEFFLVQRDEIPRAEWSATVQGTLTITRGNSETIGAGLLGQAVRKTHFDEITFEYEFGYQETGIGEANVVSERFHRGFVGYRNFISEMWGIFARNTARTNRIGGVEFWYFAEAGGSFRPAVGNGLELVFDVGLMLTYRDLIGEGGELYGGVLASGQATWDAGDNVKLSFLARFDMELGESENWNGLLRFTSNVTLTDAMSAGLLAELTYANQPAPGFNNTDFRLVATIGITL